MFLICLPIDRFSIFNRVKLAGNFALQLVSSQTRLGRLTTAYSNTLTMAVGNSNSYHLRITSIQLNCKQQRVTILKIAMEFFFIRRISRGLIGFPDQVGNICKDANIPVVVNNLMSWNSTFLSILLTIFPLWWKSLRYLLKCLRFLNLLNFSFIITFWS